MNTEGEFTSDLLEEAADWFLRVRTARPDSEVHVAWLAWIEASPTHRAAFSEIQETWDVVGHVDSPPWPRPEELVSQTRAPRLRWLALAAGLIVAVIAPLFSHYDVAGWVSGSGRTHARIATRLGEEQSAVLPDGSRIELGGLTAVRLQFTSERRLVIADEGEVFYKVER